MLEILYMRYYLGKGQLASCRDGVLHSYSGVLLSIGGP